MISGEAVDPPVQILLGHCPQGDSVDQVQSCLDRRVLERHQVLCHQSRIPDRGRRRGCCSCIRGLEFGGLAPDVPHLGLGGCLRHNLVLGAKVESRTASSSEDSRLDLDSLRS